MSALRIEIQPNIAWFKAMSVADRMTFLQTASEKLERDFGGPVTIYSDHTLLEPNHRG